MVMVWLGRGQGEVRGACAPPSPTPQIAPPGSPPHHPKSTHLDPPPNRPSERPPPKAPPSPPPPHSPLLDTPAPPSLCRPKFQPPQSEGAGRGLVPLGDQETGEQTFCCPHPPQQKWGRTESRPSTPPPPPRMPSHPHCRPSHGDQGHSGSGRRATSMLGSGTRMVTQQVVLLSHTSEQVDPSTTLPPPPPSLRPRREGCRESAPSRPKKWRL